MWATTIIEMDNVIVAKSLKIEPELIMKSLESPQFLLEYFVHELLTSFAFSRAVSTLMRIPISEELALTLTAGDVKRSIDSSTIIVRRAKRHWCSMALLDLHLSSKGKFI